jgi:hypothetical protein
MDDYLESTDDTFGHLADCRIVDLRYPELHAWLEYYLEGKSGIITELTPRLHENYQQWLMKNSLTEAYDCNYHRFATRLMHNHENVKVTHEYVKKVGSIRKSVIDVSATLKSLW